MIQEAGNHRNNKWSGIIPWLWLGLIILFVVWVRLRLLDIPLERDEGEYAYMGQLLLQGIPPYSQAYNMKFPGTYLIYAVILAVFGQTIQSIHLGLMLVNCATILLLFVLAGKILKTPGAIAASCTFAVLSLSPSVLGFAAHATHFVTLAAVGGTLLLFHAAPQNRPGLYFLSGLLFGFAGMMKQPGFLFLLFGIAYILYSGCRLNSWKQERPFFKILLRISLLITGAVLPFFIAIIWLFSAGVFDKFRFWTFEYAAKYSSQIPVSMAFKYFKAGFAFVAQDFWMVWLLSIFGLAAVFHQRELERSRIFVLLFIVFSFLSICPGFYFREHYFVTLLPAVSILIGTLVEFAIARAAAAFKLLPAKLTVSILLISMLAAGIVNQKDYYFYDDPQTISRKLYGQNPFPESIKIAEFIESVSNREDKIAVLGSEPQIFFYAKRHSATGYIYVYGLMEGHEYSLKMQQEMIREIESSSPRFIVVVNVSTSWLIQPKADKYIFQWLDTYLAENYAAIGLADILSPEKTVYKWNAHINDYRIQSPYYLTVFQKKPVSSFSTSRIAEKSSN